MRFEAVAAGHLEVDLLLEQHRFLAEELAHGRLENSTQFLEPFVERRDVFDAADQIGAVPFQAFFMKNPVLAGLLGHREQVLGPGVDEVHFACVEALPDNQVAVMLERFDLLVGKDRCAQHGESSKGFSNMKQRAWGRRSQ